MGEELAIRQDPMTLAKVGASLFKSGLFPGAKNEYGAFAIVEYGYELGIGPMLALKNINIINGQLACNAQLMLALASKHGVKHKTIKQTDKGAEILFKRDGWEDEVGAFTEEDAKRADLISKDNWKKYPQNMFYWRAVVNGLRKICPDVIMGLYTVDEITEGKYQTVSDVPVEKAPEPEPAKTAVEVVKEFVEEAKEVFPDAEVVTTLTDGQKKTISDELIRLEWKAKKALTEIKGIIGRDIKQLSNLTYNEAEKIIEVIHALGR